MAADAGSGGTGSGEICTLFDDCVRVILGSADLVRKACIILPKVVSQFVLFEACNSRNHTAVEAIVRSWPHTDLSLDFMSNRYCRQRKELSKTCIEAHNYYHVLSTEDYEDCIPSIVLGLFNNLHASLRRSDIPFLEAVDLSKMRFNNSAQGKFLVLACYVVASMTSWLPTHYFIVCLASMFCTASRFLL